MTLRRSDSVTWSYTRLHLVKTVEGGRGRERERGREGEGEGERDTNLIAGKSLEGLQNFVLGV